MLINYVHFSEPEKTKTHDTKKALKNNPSVKMDQSEFDSFTLDKFERDFENGTILEYSIKQQ